MKWLMLLPEEFWLLLITGLGIAVMVRLMSVKVAFGIIGTLILIALSGPFIDSLIDMIPTWLFVILVVVVVISIFNLFVGTLFGRGTVERLWSRILYDILAFPFRLIISAFRKR